MVVPAHPEKKQARKTSRARGSVTSGRQASFTAPGLSRDDGARVADVLSERLCALIDLALTLKHVHWNVVGASFVSVHEMLDEQHAGVSRMVDATAERIATLGGVPSGLPGRLVAARTWDDYGIDRADTQAHLGALDLVYNGVIAGHRQALAAVGDLDVVSQDLLIGHTGTLEQYHWFVRSHLTDYAGGLASAGSVSELEAARSAVTRSRRSGRRGAVDH